MAARWPVRALPRDRWHEFRRGTIKGTSLALLSHVAAVGDCGRTVGLPYAHVCEVVRALHPGARTTPKSMRWYVSMAVGGDPHFEADLPRARPWTAF